MPQELNDSCSVTTEIELTNKEILKSSSGYTVTPIGLTLNPFEPERALKMKQKKMNQLRHMI